MCAFLVFEKNANVISIVVQLQINPLFAQKGQVKEVVVMILEFLTIHSVINVVKGPSV